uniref:RNA-directed DNA polymerase, eukaryota n=1 Tax=Tanacetum cinerariifolium TaxID=118510 RepID=A0A6L2P111_TANCI|nr:RNA-directed DNA polymerase, eukaryota [Tanacetum cinerariifolium]
MGVYFAFVEKMEWEAILIGDFNEVRTSDERRGSCFNQASARVFNHFISSSGLVDIKLEGFSFSWSHPSVIKMSKLDRFLVTDGAVSLFPSITALCLDCHLSDHRPILLLDIPTDFGPILFRFFHSWFNYEGFDEMVEQTWRSFTHSDKNGMIRFKKKLQDLKAIIRQWTKDKRIQMNDSIKSKENADSFQKSKIRWAIEGDENSNFFHGIINKKRYQLAIRGIFVDGLWQTDLRDVKMGFHHHFNARFKKPTTSGLKINFTFPKKLSHDQADDLERGLTRNEIQTAVWSCGDNKSSGPDGYTFEFFKKSWSFVGPDLCEAVEQFFTNGAFSKGCNSSFIALIPKAFGFGPKWCHWIRGTFCYAKASVLVNGSPFNEFLFHGGLKQGDPLAPYLFILMMESLHLSFSRVVDAGVFKGVRLSNSLSLSHIFYADGALIIGE